MLMVFAFPWSTVPPEILVTRRKPDVVLVDEKTGDVELYELTSCADKKENIKKAQTRKFVRYWAMVKDIEDTAV